MGLFELFTPKATAPPQSLTPVKTKNNYYFTGSESLRINSQALASASSAFKALLTFFSDNKTLGSKQALEAARYIAKFHPYGKKAVSIFKAFCLNQIEWDAAIADGEKTEYLKVLNSVTGSLESFQRYVLNSVLLQGGLSFWLDLDPESGAVKLINIPFTDITPKFDTSSQSWKYNSSKIALEKINASLPSSEAYKFCSDLPQFFIFTFDSSIDEPDPVSFFAAAIEDCYTETLWRRLIRESVKRLAILKHAHFKVAEPKPATLGGSTLTGWASETAAVKPPLESAVDAIKEQIASPTGKIVSNPDTEKNYVFLQSMAITDENVSMETFSTLETQAIKPLGDAVKEPLAAGLRVPAQFLGISESRTETQIEIELEMFLETVRELTEFIDNVMLSTVKFKLWTQNKELTVDYPFWIKDSDVAGNLKRQKSAKEKAALVGVGLDNLIKKGQLGFDTTDDDIAILGYKPVKSNRGDMK